MVALKKIIWEVLLISNKKEYIYRMSNTEDLNENSSLIYMFPSIIFSTIIISIVRICIVNRDFTDFYWYNNQYGIYDYSNISKSIALVSTTLIAIVLSLYKIFNRTFYIKKSYAYIPMAFYIFFVLLSFGMSEYKEIAFWGWNYRHEGTLVILCYMIMLFYTINTVKTEKNVKQIIYSLAAIVGVLNIIGIMQSIGIDPFKMDIIRKLTTPPRLWNQISKIKLSNFGDYQTVGNMNYVSFYISLIIPIITMLFIHAKKLIEIIIFGSLYALLYCNLILASSSGGIFGIAVSCIIALFIFRGRIITWKKQIITLLLISIIISISLIDLLAGEFRRSIVSTVDQDSFETVFPENHIDYIDTLGLDINMSIEGNSLKIICLPNNSSSVVVMDESGRNIGLKAIDSGRYLINDKRFEMCSIFLNQKHSNYECIVLMTDKRKWKFVPKDENVFYLTGTEKLIDLDRIPSFGFEKHQAFASGRGYLWSRTIPMLKDTIFVGRGADTFCIYFPQNDYVGKYNCNKFGAELGDDKNILIDKPHSLYLGTAFGTGFLSLLALLSIFILYIIESISIYRNGLFIDFISFVGAGIFLGIDGFLISAITNDSVVSIMPIFYGLLGVGIAINMMLRKQSSKIK